jgi:histone arginine demethylase JMJD6
VYYDQRDLRYGIKRVVGTVYDYEAATWFNEVYPQLAPYRQELEMVEIIQVRRFPWFAPWFSLDF